MVDFFFKALGDHQISIFLRSALHLAAESGNAVICEMLLSKNAYVNRYTAWILFSHRVTLFFSKTKAGWTPLHYVAYKGYNELIKALVTKHNAAIDATSMVRTTFLWRVSSCSSRDLLPFPPLGLASVSRCLPLSTLTSVSHTMQRADRQNSLCKPEVSLKSQSTMLLAIFLMKAFNIGGFGPNIFKKAMITYRYPQISKTKMVCRRSRLRSTLQR